MALTLYAHPFSSYCQKVLIALYGNGVAFDYQMLGAPDSPANLELARRWPIRKFPLLVDGDQSVTEASIIIEHLDVHHPGHTRWIPADPAAALQVRFLDRFFDNYVQTHQQKVVFDALRPAEQRDARGVADALAGLEAAYAWLEQYLDGREWAVGDAPSLADCSAAPALSMRTGRSASTANAIRASRPIASGSRPGRRSRGPWRRHGRSAPTSRSARRIGIEPSGSEVIASAPALLPDRLVLQGPPVERLHPASKHRFQLAADDPFCLVAQQAADQEVPLPVLRRDRRPLAQQQLVRVECAGHEEVPADRGSFLAVSPPGIWQASQGLVLPQCTKVAGKRKG